MVITLKPYNPIAKLDNTFPGDQPHPAGSGNIRFAIRFLSRVGEVLIDFGEWRDLLTYSDNLSTESASGTWTVKARVTLGNLDLLKKLHPGCIMEAYCARNADPLEGVNRDPSKLQRIDTSPTIALTVTPQPGQSSVIMPTAAGSPTASTGFMQNFLGMKSQRARYLLAVTAITEGKSNAPQSQVDTAIAMGNRLQLGTWGKTIEGVILAPSQFTAVTDWGLAGVSDEASAIAALQRARRYGAAQAKQELDNFFKALSDSAVVRNSLDYLKGRADYRGAALSRNKQPGDIQRDPNDNWYLTPGTSDTSVSAAQAQRLYQLGLQALGVSTPAEAIAPTPVTDPAVQPPPTTEILGDAVKPVEDPYLDKCPYLLLRGIVTDYGRTVDGNTTVISITGESYGKIYKDAFVLTDTNSPDTLSQGLNIRSTAFAAQGVALIYYYILKYWVEGFWGSPTGWEARTRVIPFPPNYITRCNTEGSAWSALQAISIQGFFHIFVDHTGAIVWEKLPWSGRDQSLIAGRGWEDLPLLDLPSWKIMSWDDRMSAQGLANFVRCLSVQGGGRSGYSAVAYNMGSIRQYGGPNKRELEFPIGQTPDSYYTSAPLRKEQATNSSFVDLCLLECIRWYDRPVQRVGVTLRGDAAWRIHCKVRITENWSYKAAKPAEYYISSRSHTIDLIRPTWTTQLNLVRDRRSRYLGIGVGEVKIVDESLSDPAKQAEKKNFTKFDIPFPDKIPPVPTFDKANAIAKGVQLTPINSPSDLNPNEVVELPPEARVPLVPDDYYWFNRFKGKIERIGNDTIAWAKKNVIPKLGEETKPVEVKMPEANTGIASPTGPAAPFTPVDRIYTSGNFYDPSPTIDGGPYNYDFTLSRGGTGFFTNDEINTPIPSPVTGVVKTVARNNGYGNYVEVTGTDKITWLIAHMNSVSVRQGQSITRGQTLGIQGFTGIVRPSGKDGTHMH
ncbi:MAG TPA: peptidoglycan DD-metalloendopeptidase family protein, partial [Coleofasciculaceae cyanobacterium]